MSDSIDNRKKKMVQNDDSFEKEAGETSRSHLRHLRRTFATEDYKEKILHIQGKTAILCFLEGMVDDDKKENIIEELGIYPLGDYVHNQTEKTNDLEKIEEGILNGRMVMMTEGASHAYIFPSEKSFQRAYTAPTIDNTVKGSKISFVESYQTNVALLRRLAQDRRVRTVELKIGTNNQSIVSLMYIEGLSDENIIEKVKKKLSEVKEDKIINVNQLSQLLEDNDLSPFPQTLTTERPDQAAFQLLDGKVCVILDRSSEVIILPVTFFSFFRNIDDYSNRTMVASFNRLLRFVATFITLFLPGIYISMISYNYEIIPLKLILSIGESRSGVPFGPFFEALIMGMTIDMLREASIRLPSPISTTVGVVGGIVIGQAAVQASIVSNLMVIVVSLTAIASFIIPNHEMSSSLSVLRYPIMIMAFFFGLTGITLSAIVVILHILQLDSYGNSYSKPFSPINKSLWRDTFIRIPLKMLLKKEK